MKILNSGISPLRPDFKITKLWGSRETVQNSGEDPMLRFLAEGLVTPTLAGYSVSAWAAQERREVGCGEEGFSLVSIDASLSSNGIQNSERWRLENGPGTRGGCVLCRVA